jgi:hypothetical protein
MAYHLRRLPEIAAWSQVADSSLWDEGDCPWQVLSQVFDNRGGVSTWLVSTPDEIERAVAAQAFARSTIPKTFGYCLIDEAILKRERIKAAPKPVVTVDPEIGKLHHEIIELCGKQLVKLAWIIRTECEILDFAREDILSIAARHFGSGRFERGALFQGGSKGRSEEEVANSKSLLVNLWKRAELSLIGPS